jgi:putative methionine-R-sulfoxide reductase with GAF domain
MTTIEAGKSQMPSPARNNSPYHSNNHHHPLNLTGPSRNQSPKNFGPSSKVQRPIKFPQTNPANKGSGLLKLTDPTLDLFDLQRPSFARIGLPTQTPNQP